LWRSAYRIRCKPKLKALTVTRRCAVPHVHVSAANPFRAGCDPNLITGAIITSRRANSMGAVAAIVARRRRIVPAWITGTVMNAIVPVVIVTGSHSVPAAIVRLNCIVGPANTGVRTSNNDSLAGIAERPNLRSHHVIDARLNCIWHVRLETDFLDRGRVREIVDHWISFNPRDIRSRG